VEIIEIYQWEPAIHAYRRTGEGAWVFEAIGGLDAALSLASVGLSVPLAEIYEGLDDLA
jgi:hypothetical protein